MIHATPPSPLRAARLLLSLGVLLLAPVAARAEAPGDLIEQVRAYLAAPRAQRLSLRDQPFAAAPLSRGQAQAAEQLLWEEHAHYIATTRRDEMSRGAITVDGATMRFAVTRFGDKPPGGRSLYISMHGGGVAPARVNDQQWENQKRLYQPAEGVYVAPRAPTNEWNLWHLPHIDALLDRLIENMAVLAEVDPDRVYLLGYSAGGDGVYQLAPRLADRFAAAAMMAGHPNEASPLGLRNLPFAIYVGGRDSAYDRNAVAQQWGDQLAALREADPQGYTHRLTVYPELGHWMQRRDAEALPWMAQFTRNPQPARIVWRQDDVTHTRFYWLTLEPEQAKVGRVITATLDGQRIDIESSDVDRVTVLLNDRMLDLDEPITVTFNGKPAFEGAATRTVSTLARTLAERGDPKSVYSAQVTVDRP